MKTLRLMERLDSAHKGRQSFVRKSMFGIADGTLPSPICFNQWYDNREGRSWNSTN